MNEKYKNKIHKIKNLDSKSIKIFIERKILFCPPSIFFSCHRYHFSLLPNKQTHIRVLSWEDEKIAQIFLWMEYFFVCCPADLNINHWCGFLTEMFIALKYNLKWQHMPEREREKILFFFIAVFRFDTYVTTPRILEIED
jgi:hypothetical protein